MEWVFGKTEETLYDVMVDPQSLSYLVLISVRVMMIRDDERFYTYIRHYGFLTPDSSKIDQALRILQNS